MAGINNGNQYDVNMLLKKIEASDFINEQIAFLNSQNDLNSALNEAAAQLGGFTSAERVYIFEETGEFFCNTIEWCADGVTSEMDSLQNVPKEEMSAWTDVFESGKCVVISDIEEIKFSAPYIYETLARQGIKGVVEAPIKIGSKIVGFIGVDNAPDEYLKLISESLDTLGTFIGTMIRNRDEHEKLKKNHAAIKDNRNMQREITESISCGVFAYALPEHELLVINDEARRIFGCTPSEDPIECFVRYLKERIYPDDKDMVYGAQKALSRPGDSVTLDYRAFNSGKVLNIHSVLKLLRFESGRKYILCSLLDTTEQAELTQNLETERKSYRDALANGCEFNFFFDVDEGLIHEEFITAHGVNLIQKLGFSVPASFDDLLAKYIEQCKPEFVREDMKRNFTCSGLRESFEEGITNAVTEYYSPQTDIYIRINSLMSKDDKTGHIHVSVVASDISEIRRNEKMQKKALEDANEKLDRANKEMNKRIDAILDGTSGGLKIINPEDGYCFVYISEGAADLQGYTVSEFLERFGHSVASSVYPDERDRTLADAIRQMDEKGSYVVKYRIPCKDGSIKWVIDRGKEHIDAATGKKLWYTLMQDVTELEDRNNQLQNVLSMQTEMANSLSSGFFAYTLPEREILIINDEAERMFTCIGIERENASNCMTAVPEYEMPAVREAISNLKVPGDRTTYIFHAENKLNGGHITLKTETKLLSFSDGQRYILSSITDITEQELMEKKLEEERRQYRNALALDSETMFTFDLTEGMIYDHVYGRDGNNLTANMGLSVPATYDQLAELWFSSARIKADSRDIELVRSRESLMECSKKGTTIIEFEYYVTGEGKYFRLLAMLYTLNDHVYANFIIYDITSTRKEEKQRRSMIETLGKIYSGLCLFSFRSNTYTLFKYREDIAPFLTRTGSYDDFFRVYTEEMALPEFKEEVSEFLTPKNIVEALADEDYVSLEYRRKNTGWCRITLVASERDENGDVISAVFAGNVIEGQKKAELAQRDALKAAYESANIANSAKTDFLANMSHDIRTPMNAIIGLTAIAGTHMDDKERVADCLSKITISSKHLLGIINEILDMSKIESGKMELHEDGFSLPELIDNLLSMSKAEVSAKNHELSVSIRGIEHENVIGDSQRIQQVFMNIMSNAVKYTPPGGKIKLYISEKPTNKQRIGCYEFIFEDNGIGMSEEYLAHIFEPFSRARTDLRVGKIQGTGLGMPITRNIVQMMNGDIKVESHLNEGTKMTVTFFLKLKNESEENVAHNLADLPILVADDDRVSCIYTCEMLEELGMKGEWVLTGAEAVERTVEHHERDDDFFAVILDWRMPEMDGIETTREIRKRVGKNVPIIIISAYDWSDIELEARAAGANAFISKPLFKSRVVHLFNELTGREDNENSSSELEEYTKDKFQGKRVLLVEDNELNAEIAGEIFSMAGLEVEFAKDGKAAVDIMTTVESGYFDIIFMDIQMPIMNGYEASRAIRTLPGNYTKSVPIIAMTANAFAEDVAQAKNAGMNEHIAKPIDFDQLMKALRRWIG